MKKTKTKHTVYTDPKLKIIHLNKIDVFTSSGETETEQVTEPRPKKPDSNGF